METNSGGPSQLHAHHPPPPPHKILEAITDPELLALVPLFQELRPDHEPSSPQELLRLIKILRADGLHLLYIKDTLEGEAEPRVVSTGSYKLFHSLAYYRQLYISDVITLSAAKKRGYAGALMDRMLEIAKEAGCNHVRLTSSYGQTDSHRFYAKKEFNIKSHHFCFDIDPVDKKKSVK